MSEHIPRPGMFATVRNRRGVVAAVDPYDGEPGLVQSRRAVRTVRVLQSALLHAGGWQN